MLDEGGGSISLKVSSESLEDDNPLLIGTSEQVLYDGIQYATSDVAGGSVIGMCEGEIRVGYPNILVLDSVSPVVQTKPPATSTSRSGGSTRDGKHASVATEKGHGRRQEKEETRRCIMPLGMGMESIFAKIQLPAESAHTSWALHEVSMSLTIQSNKKGPFVFDPVLRRAVEADGDDRVWNYHRKSSMTAHGYDCYLPHFLSLFMTGSAMFVQRTSGATCTSTIAQYMLGKEWNVLGRVSQHDKYLMVAMLGVSGALGVLEVFCKEEDAKDKLAMPAVPVAQGVVMEHFHIAEGHAHGARSTLPPLATQSNEEPIVYKSASESIYTVGAVYFTIHTALQSVHQLCQDLVFKILMVTVKNTGWESLNIQLLLKKLLLIDAILQPLPSCETQMHGSADGVDIAGALCSVLGKRTYTHMVHMAHKPADSIAGGTHVKEATLLLGAQVMRSMEILARMHPDVRSALVSEMLGDIVYCVFFGGHHFTFCRKMCRIAIDPGLSAINDIQHELKHRLGFLPEVPGPTTPYTTKQQEDARRGVMYHLMYKNLIFNLGTSDATVFEYREKISHAPIALETPLVKMVRTFKNLTRLHQTHVLRPANDECFARYKLALFEFLGKAVREVNTQCIATMHAEILLKVSEGERLAQELHAWCDAACVMDPM